MAVDVAPIDDVQYAQILKIAEGHFSDVKAIDIDPAKLTRTVSAFANADGGELYIGIDEDTRTHQRKLRGFPTIEAANAHLQVFEDLFPLGTDFTYTFFTTHHARGYILQVTIRKTRDIVVASNGIPYVRRGAQNLPVRKDEHLQRLRRNKGITSFENELVNTEISTIANSATIIKFMLEVIPTSEPEDWLKKQQAIVGGKPTVGGVVLFSDEPQAVLPKRCGIKIYRYKTTKGAGTRETLASDPITIEGSAYNVIYDAVETTQRIIGEISKLGPAGLEQVHYPVETLHEIITNAILHRDYSIADDVHVRIFDNRVEVESPGTLPAHITKDNILSERFARNAMIVRLINKFPNPPNKDVGEGLNTAFAAMRRLQLKDPVIEPRENAVVVHIRHERLASAEDSVMDYLETHSEITNAIARSITGITSENSMKNVFLRLHNRGLIERIPGRERGPKSAWRKVDGEPDQVATSQRADSG